MTYTTENYGKVVEFTDIQGHVVQGTIRWEDSHGVNLDIPGRIGTVYMLNTFVRRSF
jgi:hypothetical protein